jgi:hypothetical protein
MPNHRTPYTAEPGPRELAPARIGWSSSCRRSRRTATRSSRC